MSNSFSDEDDSRVSSRRKRLDEFYSTVESYASFTKPNSMLEYGVHVRRAIDECIAQRGSCRVLEFGAGCTRFRSMLAGLEGRVTFEVQDVTSRNQDHLATQADHIHICDIRELQGPYDVVFSTFAWEHITTPRQVLNHLLSIMESRGVLIIAAPRYDFPMYLSPSARHYSRFKQCRIGLWLLWRRFRIMLGGKPDFFIHVDPCVLHKKWFRDADAIHWASWWDLKQAIPRDHSIRRLRLKVNGLKAKFWEKFLLLMVEIQKP